MKLSRAKNNFTEIKRSLLNWNLCIWVIILDTRNYQIVINKLICSCLYLIPIWNPGKNCRLSNLAHHSSLNFQFQDEVSSMIEPNLRSVQLGQLVFLCENGDKGQVCGIAKKASWNSPRVSWSSLSAAKEENERYQLGNFFLLLTFVWWINSLLRQVDEW